MDYNGRVFSPKGAACQQQAESRKLYSLVTNVSRKIDDTIILSALKTKFVISASSGLNQNDVNKACILMLY